jgi:hypothetical protein
MALLLRERILSEEVAPRRSHAQPRRLQALRGFAGALAAGASLALATAVAALFIVASPGGGPAVEDAAASVRQAAKLTVASAKESGTAVVRITNDHELWAQKTIRWNGGDLSVSDDAPQRPGHARSELLLVDGLIYGIDPADGAWVEQGGPENIDPDSGTTPDEYLAAVGEDVGGATLRRLTDAMTGLTTEQLEDGSTVYTGSVAAKEIARESGYKEGQTIRVLPFGYVAHGEGADPAAAVAAALTVGADGIVRDITVTWGSGASAWVYRVSYSRLGATPALEAPADARSLLRDRLRAGE